jgi:NADPH2:quinone reductase
MSMKSKQVVFTQFGSPEVLQYVDHTVMPPQAGEVLVKTLAIGVNYSDSLRRRNVYFQPTPLPCVPGAEVVGEIVAVGEGVDRPFEIGVRVLAILPVGGGYAEVVKVMAQYCIPLPPSIDSSMATGIFVQGTTAQLMMSQLAGDLSNKNVLINAAAGGVGSLLVQLAKMKGAKVFAAGSSIRKLATAKANGADILINYAAPGWSDKLKNATGGEGVDIVFEMVGGEVYNQSIRSLKQGGQLIVYGCASGVQGSIHPEYFVDENISQTGFNLAWYIRHKTFDWQKALEEVIALVAQAKLKIDTTNTYPLKDAAEAHRQIEARRTTGKVVLIP